MMEFVDWLASCVQMLLAKYKIEDNFFKLSQ